MAKPNLSSAPIAPCVEFISTVFAIRREQVFPSAGRRDQVFESHMFNAYNTVLAKELYIP